MRFRSKEVSKARLSPGPDDTGVDAVQIGIHQPIRRSIMPASVLDKRTLVQHGNWPGKRSMFARTMDCVDEVSLTSVFRPCLPL